MFRKNYYQILGVTPEAEDVVIRAAYRALVQKYHPDKFAGASLSSAEREELSNQVREIQDAYRILSSPNSRAEFDGKTWPDHEGPKSVYPQWLDGSEAKSWQTLVTHYPKFKAYFTDLELSQPEIAREYKTLVMELLSEGIVANIIRKIVPSKEFMDQEINSDRLRVLAKPSNTKHEPD